MNEPNTTNRTIAAAMKPNSRPLPPLLRLPACAMLPSASNSTPPPEAEVIVLVKCRAWSAVILFWLAALVNVTSAKATFPPGAICRAPAAV